MLRAVHAALLMLLVLAGEAVAQATTTPATTPTAPAAPDAATTAATGATDGEFNWLWAVIVVALIAAVVWYLMNRRGTPSRT
ncbi:hypothetical protein OPKNFCMD_5912 [Methylobacterium crusticola]|uniref:LPXTG cell wall anchor domain-containing protein n=1 Tax=Methylobacterium crusticola TaxID=1697972 RepID=A0ABQ4R721_9HYPH|nr:hypothetical protein [Methylobacterium crusticola]GJD53141.1 hypothetical protein OPKNFCMD_5912 [Methylobacterium crusticola]